METISYTTARANLAQKMSEVCINHAPIAITRAHNEPIVMLSLQDYEAIEETNYLLQSPVNSARINDAIDEIEMMIEKTKKCK